MDREDILFDKLDREYKEIQRDATLEFKSKIAKTDERYLKGFYDGYRAGSVSWKKPFVKLFGTIDDGDEECESVLLEGLKSKKTGK